MGDYHEGLEEGIKIGKAEATARIAELEELVAHLAEMNTDHVRDAIPVIARARAALEGGKKDE